MKVARTDISTLLEEWNDPLGVRTMSEAEELIDKLQIELAGKDAVIQELEKDVLYYKKTND